MAKLTRLVGLDESRCSYLSVTFYHTLQKVLWWPRTITSTIWLGTQGLEGGFEPGEEQNRRGQLKRQELQPITASRLILPSQMC